MKKDKPAKGTLNAEGPHIAPPDPWGRTICILEWDNGEYYFKNGWGYRSPRYPDAAATFRAAAACGYRQYADGCNYERKIRAIPKRYITTFASPVCGGTQVKIKWSAYKLKIQTGCPMAARLQNKFPGLRISIKSADSGCVTGPDCDVSLAIQAEYLASLGLTPLGVNARSISKTS